MKKGGRLTINLDPKDHLDPALHAYSMHGGRWGGGGGGGGAVLSNLTLNRVRSRILKGPVVQWQFSSQRGGGGGGGGGAWPGPCFVQCGCCGLDL